MEVTNADLLMSQEALQELTDAKLKGTHALRLKDITSEVQTRLTRLSEVQSDLHDRDDLSEEEADEEWSDVLEDTLEVDEEPLPRQAFENIEISAQTLMALDWLTQD